MQSRGVDEDDEATLSADMVEKWLDSNTDWLSRYLRNRRTSREEIGVTINTASNETSNQNRKLSICSRSQNGVESTAGAVLMPSVPTSRTLRGGYQSAAVAVDSAPVRRSASWTRRGLSQSREGAPQGSASLSMITVDEDWFPKLQLHQQTSIVNNSSCGDCVEAGQQQQQQQKSNSRKHLRYDFAKSHLGHNIGSKVTTGSSSSTQHSSGNVNTSVAIILCEEPSFASFDSVLDPGVDPLRVDDNKQTLAERRRSSLKAMRNCLSLPTPSSSSALRMLIESRVRLPPRGGASGGDGLSEGGSNELQMKRDMNSRLNSRDFFLEMVRDVSCDLDLSTLVRKILVNVVVLAAADRVTLHFVEGSPATGNGKVALVSHSFDARDRTPSDARFSTNREPREGSSAPWGQGVVGYVAETGIAVNTSTNTLQNDVDPSSALIHNIAVTSPTTDDVTNSSTCGHSSTVTSRATSLLCLPIQNADGDVIAVCSVHGKTEQFVSAESFTVDDEKMLATYLAFCGMAISNAQAIEAYTREYDRNKALLEVVHDLFEEQTSVEAVVTTIMNHARSLLKCERCVVVLDGQSADSSASKIESASCAKLFEIQSSGSTNGNDLQQSATFHYPTTAVLTSNGEGEKSNGSLKAQPTIHDVASERTGGFNCNGVLCKPIRDNNFQTIGAAQLVNKLDGSEFDEADEQLFEAFTIFCGLGINNCLIYDEMARAAAKQTVALEVLSYHATVSTEQVQEFEKIQVPSSLEWKLNSLDFDDFSLASDEMVLASIRIFSDIGLIRTLKIDYETVVRWLLTVRKNYRNIAYHNWRHAFNVCQCMFAVLQTCHMRQYISDIECLALIVACLCHDLDHRGTNNSYQHKSSSALAQLYGTEATLEHHHFNHAVMILNSEDHNIFVNLSSDDYCKVMNLLKEAILATDLSLHIQVRKNFVSLVESGCVDWNDVTQRQLLRSVLMTTCDIAAITKPWDIQLRAANLVIAEFFEQGDKEKNVLKIQPPAIMDREKQHELPRLQLDWIDGICLPLYQTLTQINVEFKPMLDNVLSNRQRWQDLSSGDTNDVNQQQQQPLS